MVTYTYGADMDTHALQFLLLPVLFTLQSFDWSTVVQ